MTTDNFFELLGSVLMSVSLTPSENQGKLWYILWEFVDRVLTSSMKWLQKTKKNSPIRSLILRIYKLSTYLINNHDTASLLPLVQKINDTYTSALIANFRWFTSVDTEIRGNAVQLVKCMLQIAQHMEINVSQTVIDSLHGFTSGKVTSQTTEAEKHILNNWENSFEVEILDDDEIEIIEHVAKPPIPLPIQNVQKPPIIINKWEMLTKNIFPRPLQNKGIKKPNSKLSRMRQELEIERKPINEKPVYKTTFATREVEDNSSLSHLVETMSPEKIKRQMKTMDMESIAGFIPSSVTAQNIKSLKIGNISNIHKKILQWDYPPEESKRPPNFDVDIKSIPNTFGTTLEYAGIFEPFLLLECWENLLKARDEVKMSSAISMSIESAIAIDGFYGMRFYI